MQQSLINITKHGTKTTTKLVKEELDSIEYRGYDKPDFLADIFYPHNGSNDEYYTNLLMLGEAMLSTKKFNKLFFKQNTLPLYLVGRGRNRIKIRFKHLQQKYGINRILIIGTDTQNKDREDYSIYFNSVIGDPIENYTIENQIPRKKQVYLRLEEANIVKNVNFIGFDYVDIKFEAFKYGIEVRDINTNDIYPRVVEDVKGYFDKQPGGLCIENIKINGETLEENENRKGDIRTKKIFKGITLPYTYSEPLNYAVPGFEDYNAYTYNNMSFDMIKEYISFKLNAFFRHPDGLCYIKPEVEDFVKFRERIPENVRFNIINGDYEFTKHS